MLEHSGATVTMHLPSDALGADTVSLIAERRGESLSICLCTDRPGASISVILDRAAVSALSSFISSSSPREAREVLGWLWRDTPRDPDVPVAVSYYFDRTRWWRPHRRRAEFFASRAEALINKPIDRSGLALVRVVRKKRAPR